MIPTLRWDPDLGFSHLGALISDSLEDRVGAFLVTGGPREAVATLAADLHARSAIPLLIAAEAERGAGQVFGGCTGLPPFEALTHHASPDDVRRAARITANELKSLGVNWCLAPACDHPVAGEWIDACQAQGVIACARSFPGRHLSAATDAGVASMLLGNADHAARARRELDFDGILIARAGEGFAFTADSAAARERWAGWVTPSAARETTMDDALWARQVADRVVTVVRGPIPTLSTADVVIVGEGIGWKTAHFAATLRALDVDITEGTVPSDGTRSPVIIAAFADDRPAIERTISLARHRQRESIVVVFGPPSQAGWLAADVKVVCAWNAERPMQEAAARVLVRG